MNADRIIGELLDWFEDGTHWEKHHKQTFEGTPGNYKIVSTCLLGGADMVCERNSGLEAAWPHAADVLTAVIQEQFQDRLEANDTNPMDVIVGFNDNPNTSIADVRAVLEKTRARLQEEG